MHLANDVIHRFPMLPSSTWSTLFKQSCANFVSENHALMYVVEKSCGYSKQKVLDIPFGSAHRTDGQNPNVNATSPTTV